MIHVEPEATEIHMDSNHLHQGVWTLCFNALKYGCDAAGAPAVVLAGFFNLRTAPRRIWTSLIAAPALRRSCKRSCSIRLTPRARKVSGLACSSRASCVRPTARFERCAESFWRQLLSHLVFREEIATRDSIQQGVSGCQPRSSLTTRLIAANCWRLRSTACP
jgi:hypothetical protein